MPINAYVYFDGQCEAAFKTYAKVLGGKIEVLLRYGDAPPAQPVNGGADLIMHARLLVEGGCLMGSDYPPGRSQKPGGYRVNFATADPAEAERIFAALAEGGSVSWPLAETFFASKFGMLEDRFGTSWMINCEKAMSATEATTKDAPRATTKPFTISRTFEAPRDLVWKCFTEPERMQKWWGPKGVTVITAKMDLRPGGTYHYGMRMPDGKGMWGKFVYREITPPARLVFINAFSDAQGGLTRHPMAPSWPLEMLSTFEFAEAGGKTTFTVTWTPWNATPDEEAAFDAGHDGMRHGWSGTLEQLASYLANV